MPVGQVARARAAGRDGRARYLLHGGSRRCRARGGVQRLRDQARLEQLMRLWSLKESFVKMDGFGLSLPLVRVAFAVEGGERRAGGGGEQNRE